MTRDRLYINDIELDLSEGTVIAITSKINKLEDLVSSESNATNKFKVPKTKRNIAALESADQVQSGTVIPYRKNRARLIKQGVEVITSGFAVVESSDQYFHIAVYSGNVDFFDVIERKKLTDLDLSDFAHIFNITNIFNSKDHTETDGYKYPLINYGQLSNSTRVIDPRDLRLCVFGSTCFKRTITQAGFSYDGSFFENENFLKILITAQNQNRDNQYYDVLERIKLGSNSHPLLGNWVGANAANTNFNTIHMKDQETWDFELSLQFGVQDWVNVAMGSLFQVKIDLPNATGSAAEGIVYTHTDGDGNGVFTMNHSWTSFNGGSFGGDIFKHIHILYYMNRWYPIFGELIGTKQGSTEPDFKIKIQALPQDWIVPTIVWGNFPSPQDLIFGFDLESSYGNTLVDPARELPDITQKSFVKAIGQMFNLMFRTSAKKNKIYIRTFSEIVDNIPIAKDWTSKLDMKGGSLAYRLNYSQRNLCKYEKDDSDTLIPDDWGNGAILVDDTTLPYESTAIQLPFAASFMQKRCVNLQVPSVKRIDDATGEWSIENKARLLVDDYQPIDGDPIEYNDLTNPVESTTDAPLCYFKRSDKTFNLGFDNSLLSDNYTALTKVLNKSKVISVMLKLSAADVYEFTEGNPDTEGHFVPVYFQQFSAYFYVAKIHNFTGKGLTKVDLIRIGKQRLGLIGKTQRYTLYNPDGYGQVNRTWPNGDHLLTLISMKLDGIEYASGQSLLVTAPADLEVGVGLDGSTNFIMNISDWISSLMPSGWHAYDDMNAIDTPAGSTFEIIIQYVDVSGAGINVQVRYTNDGVYWAAQSILPYTSTIL